jgi:16S rRNA (guanine527-N7)-methyltransferase
VEVCLDRLGGPPPTRVHGGSATRGAGARDGLPRDPGLLPGLPPTYGRALEHGLAALGLDLPDQARTAIAAHVRLLLAWNQAINLTSITDPEAVAVRHVLDSLTAAPLLDGVATILELGSGGGFPGLPLAALLPDARVTLLDSVAKKGRFLEAAAAGAGLADRVSVVVARAETIAATRPGGPAWEVVLARGVADLAELLELALPLLEPGGRLVAWKRGDLGVELEAATRAATALGAGEPTIRSAVPSGHDQDAARGSTSRSSPIPGLEGHVLVEIRKVRPTPRGYPRDPAARRHQPW